MLLQGREPGAARLSSARPLLIVAQLILCLAAPRARAEPPPAPSEQSVAAESPPLPEPVILLHGFDSDPRLWRGTAAVLSARGYQPLMPSWRPEPGHGAAQTARDVIVPLVDAVLEEAGYPEGQYFHLVSHSLSGLLARFLLEARDSAAAGWGGRVRSLVMLSTPHHGVRTGLAAFACRHYRDRNWRQVGCDMRRRAEFLRSLGVRKPPHVDVPYLSIGVESPASFLLVPRFDGDGDGTAHGNDNTVMAESSYLEGAPFALWRGRSLSDHFTSSCSAVVNGWIADFLQTRKLPRVSHHRVRGDDDCTGLPQ